MKNKKEMLEAVLDGCKKRRAEVESDYMVGFMDGKIHAYTIALMVLEGTGGIMSNHSMIVTCCWCLESQIVFTTTDEFEAAGWERDEDDRAFCPTCIRWFDGAKREFSR